MYIVADAGGTAATEGAEVTDGDESLLPAPGENLPFYSQLPVVVPVLLNHKTSAIILQAASRQKALKLCSSILSRFHNLLVLEVSL